LRHNLFPDSAMGAVASHRDTTGSTRRNAGWPVSPHQWRRPRGRPVAVNRGEELYRLLRCFIPPATQSRT
jgi:hypothetical protein